MDDGVCDGLAVEVGLDCGRGDVAVEVDSHPPEGAEVAEDRAGVELAEEGLERGLQRDKVR